MILSDMLNENVILKQRIAFIEGLLKVWKEEDKQREIKQKENEKKRCLKCKQIEEENYYEQYFVRY